MGGFCIAIIMVLEVYIILKLIEYTPNIILLYIYVKHKIYISISNILYQSLMSCTR